MAFLYSANLSPSKQEVLQAWVPKQRWVTGIDTQDLEVLGAYRFDDPDDEVGIETHLLRTRGSRTLQVPLTYRGAPLEGGTLIATMQHSVLGERWVYDACTDPVYVRALASTIATGGTEATLEFERGGRTETRESPVRVQGSGGVPVAGARPLTVSERAAATVVGTGAIELAVLHLLGATTRSRATLTGVWPGRTTPTLLAYARRK